MFSSRSDTEHNSLNVRSADEDQPGGALKIFITCDDDDNEDFVVGWIVPSANITTRSLYSWVFFPKTPDDPTSKLLVLTAGTMISHKKK